MDGCLGDEEIRCVCVCVCFLIINYCLRSMVWCMVHGWCLQAR